MEEEFFLSICKIDAVFIDFFFLAKNKFKMTMFWERVPIPFVVIIRTDDKLLYWAWALRELNWCFDLYGLGSYILLTTAMVNGHQ